MILFTCHNGNEQQVVILDRINLSTSTLLNSFFSFKVGTEIFQSQCRKGLSDCCLRASHLYFVWDQCTWSYNQSFITALSRVVIVPQWWSIILFLEEIHYLMIIYLIIGKLTYLKSIFQCLDFIFCIWWPVCVQLNKTSRSNRYLLSPR